MVTTLPKPKDELEARCHAAIGAFIAAGPPDCWNALHHWNRVAEAERPLLMEPGGIVVERQDSTNAGMREYARGWITIAMPDDPALCVNGGSPNQ